jgi:hypothetical protein
MAASSVGADVHQTFDVHRLPTSQVSFDLIVGFYRFSEGGYVGIAEVFDAGVGVDTCLGDNFFGSRRPNSVDVTQTYFNSFVTR